MFLLYNFLLIIVYKIFAPIYAIFSKKTKNWLIEQKKIKDFTKKINKNKKIWFHCASVGEYEQIKPIITYFENNSDQIIITFFSPTAYKYLKNKITHPCSLIPFDIKKNIKDFIEIVNPEKILIAKNEIWANLINQSFQKSIPIYLIGAKIKDKNINNVFYGKYYCHLLKKINRIFVQDKKSKKLLDEAQ